MADPELTIHAGTPESRAAYEQVTRAIGLTERLNRIPFEQQEAIRQAWSELTGAPVDPTFSLHHPVTSPFPWGHPRTARPR